MKHEFNAEIIRKNNKIKHARRDYDFFHLDEQELTGKHEEVARIFTLEYSSRSNDIIVNVDIFKHGSH